jgi:hypothetical protein
MSERNSSSTGMECNKENSPTAGSFPCCISSNEHGRTTRTAWAINGLLAVILALLGVYYFKTSPAFAHARGGGWETDGIMAISAPGTNDNLVIVNTDPDVQNIMVYKASGGAGKFKLIGARSYKYDFELEDSSSVQKGDNPIEKNGAKFQDVYKLYNEANKPVK